MKYSIVVHVSSEWVVVRLPGGLAFHPFNFILILYLSMNRICLNLFEFVWICLRSQFADFRTNNL